MGEKATERSWQRREQEKIDEGKTEANKEWTTEAQHELDERS